MRVQDLGAWYRAAYVFKLSEAVFVLHCFQKWTNAMSKNDREIIEERYKDAVRWNEQLKRKTTKGQEK